MSFVRAALVGLLTLGTPLASQENGQDTPETMFRVAPGDALRIDFYGQPELSRTYPVRPDGDITLHLLGAIPVEGLTLTEIETAVRDRAREVFQNATASVIVDMEQYRDIYVQGIVSNPGAFAYRPGLTALQAISLAGGTGSNVRSESAADLNRILERQRDLSIAQKRIADLEERLARADAQLADEEVENPLATVESRIVQTEIEGHRLRRELAESEGELHRRNSEILNSRLARAEAEVERITDLSQRGLVRADQLQDVEERADRFRSDLLDLSAEIAQAERTQADAKNAAELAQLDYRESLLRERERVERDLDVARVEERAIRDALRQLGGTPAAGLSGDLSETWVVYREDAAGLRVIEADPGLLLLPGDVLSVTLGPDPQ